MATAATRRKKRGARIEKREANRLEDSAHRERVLTRCLKYFDDLPLDKGLELARDQRCESVVGRLFLRKCISQDQYNAAISYADLVNQHRRLNGLDAVYEETEFSGLTDEEERIKRINGQLSEARQALTGANSSLLHRRRNLTWALDTIVLRDAFAPHLISDLKVALNVLSKFWC